MVRVNLCCYHSTNKMKSAVIEFMSAILFTCSYNYNKHFPLETLHPHQYTCCIHLVVSVCRDMNLHQQEIDKQTAKSSIIVIISHPISQSQCHLKVMAAIKADSATEPYTSLYPPLQSRYHSFYLHIYQQSTTITLDTMSKKLVLLLVAQLLAGCALAMPTEVSLTDDEDTGSSGSGDAPTEEPTATETATEIPDSCFEIFTFTIVFTE